MFSTVAVFLDCLNTFLEIMPLFLQNSKHKSITSNSIPQMSYIQVKMKLFTQNNSILLKNQTLLSDMTHKQSKTHTLQHSLTHWIWWDQFKTILHKSVAWGTPQVFYSLIECNVEYSTIQKTTTKIIILPQRPVFGLGQAKDPLQHHRL